MLPRTLASARLYAWGSHRQWKLGIDSTDDVLTPTLLTDGMTFTEVTAGYNGI